MSLNAWESQNTSSVNILLQFTWRKQIKEWTLLNTFLIFALMSGQKVPHVMVKVDGKDRDKSEKHGCLLVGFRLPAIMFCMEKGFKKVVYEENSNNLKEI